LASGVKRRSSTPPVSVSTVPEAPISMTVPSARVRVPPENDRMRIALGE
jgi:hypothetical protein